ncbi:hypothetical protein CC80DRAFT_544358 [Byssothecium circinans]|uniref:Uncharacterized protein n=1 Tax=Byssothecium circinans TaxID=147558 RepID=A0A6A5UAW0_9PLEO|nr:hypothetical protein CC80DRAFT_544358 [Byssothecium circinans]
MPPSPARFGEYRQLPKMNPYDPIPAPSLAAADSAEKLYSDIMAVFPGLVADFDPKWTAWSETWFPSERTDEKLHSSSGLWSSSASDRCLVTEFEELLVLGPKIIPLVVYKLAIGPQNCFGVQLYNELEEDKDYLVDPADPKLAHRVMRHPGI